MSKLVEFGMSVGSFDVTASHSIVWQLPQVGILRDVELPARLNDSIQVKLDVNNGILIFDASVYGMRIIDKVFDLPELTIPIADGEIGCVPLQSMLSSARLHIENRAEVHQHVDAFMHGYLSPDNINDMPDFSYLSIWHEMTVGYPPPYRLWNNCFVRRIITDLARPTITIGNGKPVEVESRGIDRENTLLDFSQSLDGLNLHQFSNCTIHGYNRSDLCHIITQTVYPLPFL